MFPHTHTHHLLSSLPLISLVLLFHRVCLNSVIFTIPRKCRKQMVCFNGPQDICKCTETYCCFSTITAISTDPVWTGKRKDNIPARYCSEHLFTRHLLCYSCRVSLYVVGSCRGDLFLLTRECSLVPSIKSWCSLMRNTNLHCAEKCLYSMSASRWWMEGTNLNRTKHRIYICNIL